MYPPEEALKRKIGIGKVLTDASLLTRVMPFGVGAVIDASIAGERFRLEVES